MQLMVKDPVTSSPFYAWFRVIRPLNLIIIAIAIVVLRYSYHGAFANGGDWILECLITLPLVFLAAGGNIINDYFDIKEDRINKPERALVGRVLKRRIALVSHWTLTAVGIVLAASLCWKIGNYIPLVIAIAISIVLFFYSTKLKGRVLIGNFAVAASISSVIPFSYADEIDTSMTTLMNLTMFIWEFGALLGLTFIIVFTRELAKDIEDIDGDKKAGHLTFPIAYSPQASWRLITALVTILLFSVGWMHISTGLDVTIGLFTGVTLSIAYFTWKKKATQVSAWLKLLLAAGLLLCYVTNSGGLI
jgi:4-hydroxybenzoate polyprenyltransferase